jgi:hypothetical protein
MNFKALIGLVSTLAMVAATAQAQVLSPTASSSSGANSSSGAVSGSSSNSGASARGGNAQTNATQGTSVGTSSGATINQTSNVPGTQTLNNVQSGHTSGDVTVRTTPTVYAPPVSGGNPCTLAVSGGVSVIGWGAAAGGTFVDQDCATRQKIAMIHNAGYAQAARELMCNDQATYIAFRGSATPCAFRQAFEPQGTPMPPMVQQQPTVITPTPVVQSVSKQYPRCNPRAGITDNCISG